MAVGDDKVLTRIHVKNFKKLEDDEIELGKNVVFVGPNNSGKTTVLQALALWEIGLRRWNEKRLGKTSPDKRPGVTINRRDLIAIPVPNANLLWREMHVRDVQQVNGAPQTQNVRIDIIVDGMTHGKEWSCGLEFDYANQESFYCRPLRIQHVTASEAWQADKSPNRMPVPSEAGKVRVAFLPPMSGLADREYFKQPGEIGVLIGQGQTAQVLRNLCWQIFQKDEDHSAWQLLTKHIKNLFGVNLLEPEYISERSEIIMSYEEFTGTYWTDLDISSSGRGLQQTLLLLAHLYANPETVLLLDEPDAHLEVLRQRQIYQLLTEVAESQRSQVIAASHSEVVLNEAATRNDRVIAFVGKPHPLNDRGSQVIKALKDFGFDQYLQAKQTGWVLYLEGPTDLDILREFAKKLRHPVLGDLERPFVTYVSTNLPQKAREHFYALKEAKQDLLGIAIFDHLNKELQSGAQLKEMMWRRREIENYLCTESVLLNYARGDQSSDLFEHVEAERREEAMRKAIAKVTFSLETLNKPSPLSPDIKASEDFLVPVFDNYFKELGLPDALRKADYHTLARFVTVDQIGDATDVPEKLDAIHDIASRARPELLHHNGVTDSTRSRY